MVPFPVLLKVEAKVGVFLMGCLVAPVAAWVLPGTMTVLRGNR